MSRKSDAGRTCTYVRCRRGCFGRTISSDRRAAHYNSVFPQALDQGFCGKESRIVNGKIFFPGRRMAADVAGEDDFAAAREPRRLNLRAIRSRSALD